MVDMDIKIVVALIAGFFSILALGLSALVWDRQKRLEIGLQKRMQKDIEKYKSDLSRQLEAHKSDLAKQVETHKSELQEHVIQMRSWSQHEGNLYKLLASAFPPDFVSRLKTFANTSSQIKQEDFKTIVDFHGQLVSPAGAFKTEVMELIRQDLVKSSGAVIDLLMQYTVPENQGCSVVRFARDQNSSSKYKQARKNMEEKVHQMLHLYDRIITVGYSLYGAHWTTDASPDKDN
jgi:hypothetical protein